MRLFSKTKKTRRPQMLQVDAGIPEKRLAAIVIFTVSQLCQSGIGSRVSPPLQMTLVMDIIMYRYIY